MRALQTGISATRILTVQGDALYSPTGHAEHSVLSSPAMIMEMELACVDALGGHLSENKASVGFHVDVKHIAPAQLNKQVQTTATLINISGRKLKFEVITLCGDILIGAGSHRRAIIHL
jgi:predicted thioesterase|tara:strand:- start:54 stop:410 length:357 start_codon:yes stop_codon:yes gene_type:complete